MTNDYTGATARAVPRPVSMPARSHVSKFSTAASAGKPVKSGDQLIPPQLSVIANVYKFSLRTRAVLVRWDVASKHSGCSQD